jgi:ParB family chromosome partitioning protein
MSAKQTGLGRGFDSLLPTDFDPSMLLDKDERVQKLSVDSLVANVDQPRKQFDEIALNELAASIKRYGILQPLVVQPLVSGTYEIIAGERRFRAAQKAGLTTVPAIVRSAKAQERLEIALIENVQRVDLSPLEQAVSIVRLHEQFNLAYAEVAKRLGKAETTISNIVRLIQLPADAQAALQAGRISEGHARAILALKGLPEQQARLLQLIEGQAWSVRQAEQYVTALKQGAKTHAKAAEKVQVTTAATEKLSKTLKTPVTIRRAARGGKLEIRFNSDEDLERIVNQLST